MIRYTFSSSSSTAFAISFFCSNVESSSSLGTLARMTEPKIKNKIGHFCPISDIQAYWHEEAIITPKQTIWPII